MKTLQQQFSKMDETYLIEHYKQHREVIKDHELFFADRMRNPWIHPCRQHGVRSYVALSHKHLRSALKRGQLTQKVLTPLALAVISTTWFLNGPEDVRMVWRVTPEYVRDLVRLFEKGELSMEGVYQASLNHIREEVRLAAESGATFLRQVCDGTIPAPVGMRAKYASLALARVGFGPIAKSLTPVQHDSLSRGEIEEIKRRAIEAKIDEEIERSLEKE